MNSFLHKRSVNSLKILIILALLSPLTQIPLGAVIAQPAKAHPTPIIASAASFPTTSPWNPRVTCTPIVVRISDITNNSTGSTSLNNSPFTPGITTTVSGGVAKRWLTPGPTPSGWHSPGPACTVTNSKGTIGVFVEIDGIERASITQEDSASSYDATNGGSSHSTTYDNTFNAFDPAIVKSYSSSCTSSSDPTCYGRIHMEIDHDWLAAGYCGSGTVCDPSALSSQTSSSSTLIDFQGFVFWDSGSAGNADHQFSGWELHPLTGWKLHSSPPPTLSVSFNWSPTNPTVNQAVSFTSTVSGGTSPYTYSWNFGDGSTSTSANPSHSYTATGSYSVTLRVTDSKSVSGQTSGTVTVSSSGTPDFGISLNPTSLSASIGATVTSTVSLSSLSAFSGTVSLSASASPSGPSISLSPASVTLTSSGSGSSTLSFTTSSTGTYTVTVTGTSGSLSHSATLTVTVSAPPSTLVASDGAPGPTSLATSGAEKIIQDSFGRSIALYVDSSGRLGLSYANGSPTLGWSTPVKSATPTSGYIWPNLLMLSSTSLQIIAVGGSAAGVLSAVPVTIQRDGSNNITGFTFGAATILDSSGLSRYPSATLAHNGDILLAWAVQNTTRTVVKSLRWDPVSGWKNLAGTSSTPDTILSDTTLQWFVPSLIERGDNFNVYVFANRFTGPPSTVAFNKATWNGSTGWTWGAQNLTYESNASDADDDQVGVVWDPINSLVVVEYGITGTLSFGVFTLNALDQKVHIDTPSLSISGDRGWAGIGVHSTTGDYYLFMINVASDGGSGPLGYIRHPSGGAWTSAIVWLDNATTNQALSVRSVGTSPTLDILYAQGTSAPVQIRFARLSPLNPPNFSITANPTSLTPLAGSPGTSTISVSSIFNFTGTVSLSATVSPSGLSATFSPTSVSVPNGGIASSTLTVSGSTSIYTVTITGTSGSLGHSVLVVVRVQDFSISASPSPLNVPVGNSGSATATFTSINGFVGNVAITDSSSPSGLSITQNPASVAVPSAGSATSTLTVGSNNPGLYTVTITGTTGSLSHTFSLTVNIFVPPDFGITANPSSITFQSGSTGVSTVTVSSLNGFTGTLTISRTVSPSSGLTATCSPTSITLTSGSSGNSICNFSSSTSNVYTVTVSATNGTLTHSVSIIVNVSDFTISASPTTVTLVAAVNGTSTINLAGLNGFSGTIALSLSASSGLAASISPSSVALTGSASSTLTVKSFATGTYTVTVTGASGSLTHSVTITVIVVDFSVSSSVSSTIVSEGQPASATISLSSINGFAGPVSLSATVSPSSGLTATLGPSSVTLGSGGSGNSTLSISTSVGGTYTITVIATAGGVSHTVQLSVQVYDFSINANPSALAFQSGSNATTTLTLGSLGGFVGNITINASTSSINLSVSCPSFASLSGNLTSATCSFSSSSGGTYTVTITGSSGSIVHSVTLTVGVGDFGMSNSTSSLTVQAGASGSSTITITGQGGFGGTVTLSANAVPGGPFMSLSPANVTFTPGGSGSSILTISSSQIGTYNITITGTIGSLSHSTSLTVNVVDFNLALSQSSVTALAGSSGQSTLQLSSLNGFGGTVNIAVSSPAGLTSSANPKIVTLSSGGSGSSIITVSSSIAGNYTVTITATGGSLSHTIQFTVQVQDFTLTISPPNLSVPAGTSGNSTITLTSLNGFSGTLSLTGVSSPSGLVVSLVPTSIIVSGGGSPGSATMTISSPSSITPGTYTVTVTATVSGLSHTATLAVGVPDYSISASPATTSASTGTNATSTIRLSSLGGFTGTITLTMTGSAGLAFSVNPVSVTLASGATGTSTLTVSAPTPGSYNVTVTGTSGSFTHSVTISVTVANKPQYALVTTFSGQVYKYQNGTMTLLGQPVTSALRLIAWKPDGSYALIVGDTATLIKWDGTTLTKISTTGFMSSGDDLNTIAWSPEGTYALMGGTTGDLLRWDGTTQTLSKVTDPNTRQIQGINWNPTTNVALLVGNGGALFSYKNGVITILNSGTSNDLYGVAWHPSGAYALITGSGGSIIKWNGTTATPFNTSGLYPSTTTVRYVAWNGAGTQALMTGIVSGLVLSYDGTSLTVISSGTTNGLYSLAWSGNTATLVGNSGTMLTYSNGTFKTVATGTTSNLRGIAWKPA